MKKFTKTLVYEFEGSTALLEIAKEFSDEVLHKTAPDDYKDILTKEDFIGVECLLVDVFDNFHNELFDLESLKYIGTNFTDLTMFDTEFLKSKEVELVNIQGQATEPVAQLMLNILLNTQRKTIEALTYAKKGKYGFGNFKGKEIGSNSIAVYGLGSIGSRFAEICHYFGANISHCSQSNKKDFERKELGTLTNKADVLVVTVPLTKKTRGSITKELLLQMNTGALILCPTRLDVLDTEGLISYLKENPEANFWMDGNHGDSWNSYHEELLKLDNFLVTPGNGFFTHENGPRALELTRENIATFLK